MTEVPSQIPENLTNPEGTTRLSNMLAERLKQAGNASYKTPDEDDLEYKLVKDRLVTQKRGFLGLGKTPMKIDPDELWTITHAALPQKEAEIYYEAIRRAQLKTYDLPQTEGQTADKIHKEITSNPDKYQLYQLNQRQFIVGKYAALSLLDEIIDEEEAKEKEGMVEVKPYVELSLSVGKTKGKERSINQDNVGYVHPDTPKAAQEKQIPFTEERANQLAKGIILAVADGIGGLKSGEVASGLAITKVADSFIETKSIPYPPNFLEEALIIANQAVYRPEGPEQMGTTLAVALIKGNDLYIAHVGDSRVYLLRNGELSRLTKDHSARERVNSQSPQNFITEAIGIEPELENIIPDKVNGPYPLKKGDQILLCTDGLWGPLKDKAIAKILAESKNPEDAVRRLTEAAQKAGGTDDIGLAVAKVEKLIEGKKVKLQGTQPNPEPAEQSHLLPQIVSQLRQLRKKPEGETYAASWERRDTINELEKKLEELLNLPETREVNFTPLVDLGRQLSGSTDQQVMLLKRLFASVPKELQEELIKKIDFIRENPDKSLELNGFNRLIEKAAGLTEDDNMQIYNARLNYNSALSAYEDALENPETTDEEIINRFKEANTTGVNFIREEEGYYQKIQDYIENLAQQAGIRINYAGNMTGGNLFGNLFEEISQT